MARTLVSPEARRDLVSIHQYIHDELCTPEAARRIIGELKKRILLLNDFPERGCPLDTLIPVHTEYRFLVCESYCVFYTYLQDEVTVVRILHQSQDCCKALFIRQ